MLKENSFIVSFYSAIAIVGLSFIISCSLPNKVSQLNLDINKQVVNDSILIKVYNPLPTPIRLWVYTRNQDPYYQDQITLQPFGNYTNTFKGDQLENVETSWGMGDPTIAITSQIFELPFPKGKSYKVIQGFNGAYSHTKTDYSRYAIDFKMSIGDTICAAADGYVVGVVNPYTKGGKNKKWRPYANFITLYHPKTNVYTQYVHLAHLGNLVQLGDSVKVGQPIALSGNTGFTSTPHLHFNVLKPVSTNANLESIPYDFKNHKGDDLQKGTIATH